jgi:hypothetical protein
MDAEYHPSKIVFSFNIRVLDSCNRDGAKKATYRPATPARRRENDRSLAPKDAISGGMAATKRQNTVAILEARCKQCFRTSGGKSWKELKLGAGGRRCAIHFKKAGPEAAKKLLPSVLAINGKTEIVSNAGNMTTTLAAAFNMDRTRSDDASGLRPNVKFEKLRFTLDWVLAPK